MSVAHAMTEAADPSRAWIFFSGLTTSKNACSTGRILLTRLNDMTTLERTPHRVVDYTIQAWNSFVAGRELLGFVDNATLPQVAGAVDEAYVIRPAA